MARTLLILLLALQPLLCFASPRLAAPASDARCCGDSCCCGDDGCLCSLIPSKRQQVPTPTPAPAPEQSRMLLWLPPEAQGPTPVPQIDRAWRTPTSERIWQVPGHSFQAAHCTWHT